jgi:hypothetical protein
MGNRDALSQLVRRLIDKTLLNDDRQTYLAP